MTHFIGAVVVPRTVDVSTVRTPTRYPMLYSEDTFDVEPGPALGAYLDQALLMFDETHEVPRYRTHTREEAIAEGRENIKKYAETVYAQYLADPTLYVVRGVTPEHAEYLTKEFPEKLTWNDDQVYADVVKYEEPENIDPDGSIWTTFTPTPRWDWWSIGGRWEKEYRDRQGETVDALRTRITELKTLRADPQQLTELTKLKQALAAWEEATRNPAFVKLTREEIEAERDRRWTAMSEHPAYVGWSFPHDLVAFDAEAGEMKWHRIGVTGWFGMRNDEMDEDQWIDTMLSVLTPRDPEDHVVYIDFHI